MRAGPLSSPKVIETLNREFVNVWILAKSLGPLAESASSSNVREWAARLKKDYTYPVDTILYAPDGHKLTNAPANSLSSSRRMNESGYLAFLHQGLQAWKDRSKARAQPQG